MNDNCFLINTKNLKNKIFYLSCYCITADCLYNETPPFVIIEFPIYGPDSELHQFRQIKVVPTFGYEYYPLTWLSIFAELGCGILFVNNFKTEWQKADKPTNNSYDIYGNLNLKFGLKTVIWHKDKNSSN